MEHLPVKLQGLMAFPAQGFNLVCLSEQWPTVPEPRSVLLVLHGRSKCRCGESFFGFSSLVAVHLWEKPGQELEQSRNPGPGTEAESLERSLTFWLAELVVLHKCGSSGPGSHFSPSQDSSPQAGLQGSLTGTFSQSTVACAELTENQPAHPA